MFRQVLGREADAGEAATAIDFLQQPVAEVEPTIDPRSLWSYGTSAINDQEQPIEFTPFAVFKDGRWQAAGEFPTKPPMGHAFLSTENGHTPNDPKLAVVRRFTAPFAGEIRLRGQVRHLSQAGDGIRASIWIGGKRRFMETQKKSNRPYGPIRGSIEAGQTVDLVASAGAADTNDSFSWRVSLRLSGSDRRLIETESSKHFSGPFDPQSGQPLDRLAQLAQTLLMSNEFAFID
jgi:hypothetical protein